MPQLIQLLRFLTRMSSSGGRAQIAAAVTAGVLGGATSAALVGLINTALEDGPRPGWLLPAFLALCLVLPLFRFLATFLLLRLVERAQFDLRMELSRRILSTPLRRIEEVGAHRLLATLTDDVGNIVAAFAYLPLLLMHVTVLAGCLAYMGWLSWKLLLLVLGFLVFGVICYQFPMRRAQHYFRLVREAWDRQFRQFRSLTEGIKELKLHRPRRQAFIEDELVATGRERMRYRIRATVVHSLAGSWGQVLFFLLIGLILFGAPRANGTDLRILVGFTLAILYMLTPLDVLLNMAPALNAGAVALRQVEGLGLSLASGAEPEGVDEAGDAGWRSLDLVGVTCAYHKETEDDTFTLGPIDLALRPGECVFLVGGNGSGKTTLAKVITGLYVPDLGEIRLDGRPIGDAERETYRQLFSTVFSDFYLFERLLGHDAGRIDGQARHYLEKLHLHRKVRIQDGVFSTIDLSQGQRKRLALLSVYLEDRPIYLFDEWAADQDPTFKEIFYRQLLPELKARGKTAIVISHDDRYFGVADRVVKLEDGRLVQYQPERRSQLAATALA
ncbi:MAG TPA: cyclic peptide export ABC transporter [Thermoanaerobaculia bacterium]|nr:cyclic peptide export ABC transporter [Thermoanaerobaculia bacterium]